MIRSHSMKKLSLYADGALSEAAAKHMQEHMQACPSCRHRLEEILRLRRALAAKPAPALPAHFVRTVLGKYRVLQNTASFWSGFDFSPTILRPVTLALVLASLLMLWFYPPESDPVVTDATRRYTLLFENAAVDSVLSTDDQALSFALNRSPILSAGDQK